MTARKGNAPEAPATETVTSVQEAPKKSFNLCCTYCGSKLNVSLRYESSGYYGDSVFDTIECDSTKCGAEWDEDGTLTQEPLSVRFPELYGNED
jgi:hypothetical protein